MKRRNIFIGTLLAVFGVKPAAAAPDYPSQWVDVLTGQYVSMGETGQQLYEVTKSDITIEVKYFWLGQPSVVVCIHPWQWGDWQMMLRDDTPGEVAYKLISEYP